MFHDVLPYIINKVLINLNGQQYEHLYVLSFLIGLTFAENSFSRFYQHKIKSLVIRSSSTSTKMDNKTKIEGLDKDIDIQMKIVNTAFD